MAALVAGALLAVPAGASANLVATQSASPKPVKKGDLVTITVTVTNSGPSAVSADEAQVELFPLRGSSENAANNPYTSVTASQGSCALNPTGAYYVADCALGDMPPGASAQITAVLRVNESMTHVAVPKNEAFSELPVAASTPPVVTGSPKVRLAGLPQGCVPGDFTLTITGPSVARKIRAHLFLGYDETGEGISFDRSANGRRLRATIPASKMNDPRIGRRYRLTVYAYRRGAHALRRTVSFELCL
jgi:hypothetical protein